MDVTYDFSEIDDAIKTFEHEVVRQMRDVADEGLEYARATGNYHDVTGRLRSSYKSEVTQDRIILENTAPYASAVEAKGKIVLSNAALFTENRLKEIFE